MKLRIAAIGLTAVLMAVLFAACGSKDEADKMTTLETNVTDSQTTTERRDENNDGTIGGSGSDLDGLLGGSTNGTDNSGATE